MSIQFRFRSSVTFESVDIGGRSTISVGELRAMIIRLKNLNSCQNFDLELSDAESGKEFDEDRFQLQSGASVIVKRVPAKALPSDTTRVDVAEDFLTKGSHSENLNFGASPIPATISPDTAIELTMKSGSSNIQDGLRSVSPKIQSSDTKPDVPAVLNSSANVGKPVLVEKIEYLNPVRNNRMSGRDHDALQNSNLPAEMKCPICRTYFKEAVMIPCCQRSFCANCIRQVLIDKGRCPECFSDKFTVENLLPNIALRKTIEHFLIESEKLIFESESALRKEAPDGESGIQAIDVSCLVDHKAHSPATGKGSNRVILAQNVPLGFPQANLQDEADSTNKRKEELWVETGGAKRNFVPSFGYNKVRTCYKCGSPDHLIRDCPIGFGAYPVPHTGHGVVQGGFSGYPSPYWNGSPYPPVPNMYTNPNLMMPYPMSPYGASPVIPSLYSGFSPPGGFTGMRNMEHRVDRFERPFGFSGFQPNEETFFRDQDGDDINFHGRQPDRSPQYKFNKEREHYEDILPKKSHKHQLSEHSNSEAKHGKSSRSSGRERTPDHSSDKYHRSLKKRGQSGGSDHSDRDHDRRSGEYYSVSRKRHDEKIESGSSQLRRCSSTKRMNEDLHDSDEDRKDVQGRKRQKRRVHNY